MEYIGNKALFDYVKTGFLASSHIDVSDVMACYEWALQKPKPGAAVISGFSSKMEKDVFDFLLKAHTPVIWVLARRPYKSLPPDIQQAIDNDKLLIISTSTAARQTKENAFKRNEYIAMVADKLIFTGVTESSSLYPLTEKYKNKIIELPKKKGE